jgi:hypothetical protein
MKSEVLQLLSPYKNNRKVIVQEQNVGDIIKGILNTHELYKIDYDKICMKFAASSPYQIGFKIWKFLKENVPYKIEPDSEQTLRSPAAIVGSYKGADCKSYSLWTAGIIDGSNRKGIKIPWCYRFSSYRIWDKTPQHVFVVFYPDTNKEIWVDAVLPEYNQKKEYNYKIDKKPMALVQVNGVGKISLKKKKPAAQPIPGFAPVATPVQKKNILKKAADTIKKAGKVVLKFAAAPARNSFLLLVDVNFTGIATKLNAALQKNRDGVARFWSSAGGDINALKKAIKKGEKKKRILGVGAVPALSAPIAAATPILVKLADFLKSIGIEPDDLKKAASDAAKKIANSTINKVLKTEDSSTEELMSEEEQKNLDAAIQKSDSVIDKSNGFDMNKILPIAAVGVGAYLLLRKK